MATAPTITAWDLNTNTLITHLQAITPTYSVRMNDAGEFSFKLDLTDAQQAKQTAAILALKGTPFKIIIADSPYSIRYSGIAWNTHMSSSEPVLTVAGKALTSYFTQVIATKDYNTPVDPATLLYNVVYDTQNQAGANIRLTPKLALRSPPPQITPSYTQNQFQTAAQIIADCTAAITPGTGGVDYYTTDVFTNGQPAHTLNIAAPRCGRDQTTSGAVIDISQSIQWDWPVDATKTGNWIICVGAGTGTTQPKIAVHGPDRTGGLGQMPLLQMVYQFNRINTQAELQGQAAGLLAMFGKPVAVPVVTMPIDYAPLPLGSFMIGDDIRVYSPKSPWFPQGLSEWWRIVAYTVTYPSEGVPTYQLTLNRPPIF